LDITFEIKIVKAKVYGLPKRIAKMAKQVIVKNLLGFDPPEELDGKGTQRLVDYILREL